MVSSVHPSRLIHVLRQFNDPSLQSMDLIEAIRELDEV